MPIFFKNIPSQEILMTPTETSPVLDPAMKPETILNNSKVNFKKVHNYLATLLHNILSVGPQKEEEI